MNNSFISRRSALRGLFAVAVSGTSLTLVGQDSSGLRDLVAKTQEDLKRASEFMRSKNKERTRYEKAQHALSEFDRKLAKGDFDKGKLDEALDELKEVVKDNTLESRDRDALTTDLAALRAVKELH
jgi:hypothetical protein